MFPSPHVFLQYYPTGSEHFVTPEVTVLMQSIKDWFLHAPNHHSDGLKCNDHDFWNTGSIHINMHNPHNEWKINLIVELQGPNKKSRERPTVKYFDTFHTYPDYDINLLARDWKLIKEDQQVSCI